MKPVLVYSTRVCPYCMMAKRLLKSKGANYDEVMVDTDFDRREEMVQRSGGRRTVPQIFIGGEHVGGFDDLAALERAGRLEPMLNDAG